VLSKVLIERVQQLFIICSILFLINRFLALWRQKIWICKKLFKTGEFGPDQPFNRNLVGESKNWLDLPWPVVKSSRRNSEKSDIQYEQRPLKIEWADLSTAVRVRVKKAYYQSANVVVLLCLSTFWVTWPRPNNAYIIWRLLKGQILSTK
jgi:hypothetical protein